jgi:TM2 domain-containing membrane protein YozV
MKKPMVFIVFMMLMGFSFTALSINHLIKTDSVICIITDTLIASKSDTLITSSDSLKINHDRKKKRFVSAICAFPFPFGFVGAHRVMLGTKPWIPVVYVATFGGCFGLLPLIDFCVITFSKNLEQYENNPHLFMWIKNTDQ